MQIEMVHTHVCLVCINTIHCSFCFFLPFQLRLEIPRSLPVKITAMTTLRQGSTAPPDLPRRLWMYNQAICATATSAIILWTYRNYDTFMMISYPLYFYLLKGHNFILQKLKTIYGWDNIRHVHSVQQHLYWTLLQFSFYYKCFLLQG